MTMTSPDLATALAGVWSALSHTSLTLSIYPYPIRDAPYDRLWLCVFRWILFVRTVCPVFVVRSIYLLGKPLVVAGTLTRDFHPGLSATMRPCRQRALAYDLRAALMSL